MFLSKKNALPLTKNTKNTGVKQKKILGGWGDQQQKQVKHNQIIHKSINNPKTPTVDLLSQNQQQQIIIKKTRKQSEQKQQQRLTYTELQKQQFHLQNRIVDQIVQPGGIRIKPSDNALNSFFKQAKSLSSTIIGSILLTKISQNYPFQTKAKALYTIEYLAKKQPEYRQFFMKYVNQIQNYEEPSENTQNYRKICKTVLLQLGKTQKIGKDTKRQQFIDPGYFKQQKSSLSNFIQQNSNKNKKQQAKSNLIGPNQVKNKQVPHLKGPEIKKNYYLLNSKQQQITQNLKQLNLLDS